MNNKLIIVLVALGGLTLILFFMLNSYERDVLQPPIPKEGIQEAKAISQIEPKEAEGLRQRAGKIQETIQKLEEVSIKELQDKKDAKKKEERFDLTPPIEELIRFKKNRIKVY